MRQRLEKTKTEQSRLAAVDVAPDRATLEQRYKDSDIHLILPATVRPWLPCNQPVAVHVADVLTDSIYVPKAHREHFGGYDRRVRYEIEVAYGKLAEPWVRRVALKPDPSVSTE
jgi:hypothetical protein